MTSTVVVTAHPASPANNVVRVVQTQQIADAFVIRETVIQGGASASFYFVGEEDSILIKEEFVAVIPAPRKDTP